jgi:hypothetical protein
MILRSKSYWRAAVWPRERGEGRRVVQHHLPGRFLRQPQHLPGSDDSCNEG